VTLRLEGPLAEIHNTKELKAWLQSQSRAVSVAFAARAALRVLPFVQEALRHKPNDIVLRVFGNLAFAWVAAGYSVRQKAPPTIDVGHFGLASSAATSAGMAAHVARVIVSKPSLAAAEVFNCAEDAFATTQAAISSAAFSDPAAAANMVADAELAFWSAVSIDATGVEAGATASNVAHWPLWPQRQPDWLESLWLEMQDALLGAGQEWGVWTIWYRDRLEGRVNDETREFAYVRVEEALWSKGPAVVNAEIKKRRAGDLPAIESVPADNPPFSALRSSSGANAISAAWQPVDQPPQQGVHHLQAESITSGSASVGSPSIRVAEPTSPLKPSRRKKQTSPGPDVPPQRPAALEPVWSNGKLVLPSKHARTDGNIKALSAALKVLRTGLIELADDTENEPSNFDKRVVPYLRRIGERIPDHRPSQKELFLLAHMKEFLEAYSNTANEEWPNHLATRLHLLALHFDRTVRQFPKWREFVRNAQGDRLTVEQAAEVPALANAMISALREDEARSIIDPAIPSALEALQKPLEGEIERLEHSRNLFLAEDIVESVDNVIKRIAEAALATKNSGLKYGQKWKEGFVKEAFSSAEKDGGKAFIWMKRTLVGIITGAPAIALLSQFDWVKTILHLLAR
jgi:hypothetical protein